MTKRYGEAFLRFSRSEVKRMEKLKHTCACRKVKQEETVFFDRNSISHVNFSMLYHLFRRNICIANSRANRLEVLMENWSTLVSAKRRGQRKKKNTPCTFLEIEINFQFLIGRKFHESAMETKWFEKLPGWNFYDFATQIDFYGEKNSLKLKGFVSSK